MSKEGLMERSQEDLPKAQGTQPATHASLVQGSRDSSLWRRLVENGQDIPEAEKVFLHAYPNVLVITTQDGRPEPYRRTEGAALSIGLQIERWGKGAGEHCDPDMEDEPGVAPLNKYLTGQDYKGCQACGSDGSSLFSFCLNRPVNDNMVHHCEFCHTCF